MGSSFVRISAALANVRKLYLDTAPLIYYVEEHPAYVDRMEQVITFIEDNHIAAASSVISLTEALYQPILQGRNDLEQAYRTILLDSQYFYLLAVSQDIADSAAHIRVKYNLRTPDALHVATANVSSCDAFLTNDKGLRKVTEVAVLVVDDLELDI